MTVGVLPKGVAINPADVYAYVANNGGSSVSVINTSQPDSCYCTGPDPTVTVVETVLVEVLITETVVPPSLAT